MHSSPTYRWACVVTFWGWQLMLAVSKMWMMSIRRLTAIMAHNPGSRCKSDWTAGDELPRMTIQGVRQNCDHSKPSFTTPQASSTGVADRGVSLSSAARDASGIAAGDSLRRWKKQWLRASGKKHECALPDFAKRPFEGGNYGKGRQLREAAPQNGRGSIATIGIMETP